MSVRAGLSELLRMHLFHLPAYSYRTPVNVVEFVPHTTPLWISTLKYSTQRKSVACPRPMNPSHMWIVAVDCPPYSHFWTMLHWLTSKIPKRYCLDETHVDPTLKYRPSLAGNA